MGFTLQLRGQKVVIGSYHFVFEDESCVIREEFRERFEHLPQKNILIFISRLRMNWLL